MAVDRRVPQWPTVVATTLRLWLGRRKKMLGKLSWRRRAAVVLTVAFLVAGLAVSSRVLASGSASAARHEAAQGDHFAGAPRQNAAVGRAAALWVTRQVSRSAMVACDPGMCRALREQGFPAGNVLVLGSRAEGLRYCDLVVATQAVRDLAGSGLQLQDAPAVIASFGSGEERIDVRAVAGGGARAYRAALAADWAARRTAAAELVKSPRIQAKGGARLDLLAGKVDSRLLITLAALAVSYPVRVVMFGDSGPGASAGVPMREMEIAGAGDPGKRHSELRRIRSFVLMQHAVFQPARVSQVRLAPGGTALLIEFGAPDPLGLLHGRPVNQ
jgi:hypothetical protein